MPNLELAPKNNLSSFRRIAIGTWTTAYDPSVYGSMKLRVGEAIRYRDEFRARTGRHITLTHMMAKAIAGTLAEMPDANAILRWNRIYLRKTIGVFFQVAMQDPVTGELDLSGKTIHEADKKSLLECYDEFTASVAKVRAGKDKELEGTRSTFKSIPFALLNVFLKVLSILLYTFNLDMRSFGVPKDAFGSVMVTNIGALGLEAAYVPLVPYSRVPLLIAMGAVEDEPIVVDGEIRVEKIMRIYATFDHRILDGSHASTMSRVLRQWWENPFEHFDNIDDAAAAAAMRDEERREAEQAAVEAPPAADVEEAHEAPVEAAATEEQAQEAPVEAAAPEEEAQEAPVEAAAPEEEAPEQAAAPVEEAPPAPEEAEEDEEAPTEPDSPAEEPKKEG